MNVKRFRNLAFAVVIALGFAASREAALRGEQLCLTCIGWLSEHCEPAEEDETGARTCRDGSNGQDDCTLDGEVCGADTTLQ